MIYHTTRAATVRQYVADELQIPAMEQTSFETVQALERNTLVDARDVEQVSGMLLSSPLQTTVYFSFSG